MYRVLLTEHAEGPIELCASEFLKVLACVLMFAP